MSQAVIKEIEAKKSDFNNVRGIGTILAWDLPTTEKRDELIRQAMNNGLLLGGCGSNSVRLRPSLVFHQHHAQELLQILNKTVDTVLN